MHWFWQKKFYCICLDYLKHDACLPRDHCYQSLFTDLLLFKTHAHDHFLMFHYCAAAAVGCTNNGSITSAHTLCWFNVDGCVRKKSKHNKTFYLTIISRLSPYLPAYISLVLTLNKLIESHNVNSTLVHFFANL